MLLVNAISIVKLQQWMHTSSTYKRHKQTDARKRQRGWSLTRGGETRIHVRRATQPSDADRLRRGPDTPRLLIIMFGLRGLTRARRSRGRRSAAHPRDPCENRALSPREISREIARATDRRFLRIFFCWIVLPDLLALNAIAECKRD